MLHNRLDATTNYGFGVFPINTTSASPTMWGWTVGAGVEQAVSPAWSVKLEYGYLDFGSASLSTPATFSTTPGALLGACGGVFVLPARLPRCRQPTGTGEHKEYRGDSSDADLLFEEGFALSVPAARRIAHSTQSRHAAPADDRSAGAGGNRVSPTSRC